MKDIGEQSHYELLEVPRDATPENIERAHEILSWAFSKQSLATYSLYEESEARVIRERFEEAFRVLGDKKTRKAYDASLEGESTDLAMESSELESESEDPCHFELIPGDTGEPLDGSQLRRWRLQRGVEIDEVAEGTKVNPRYLRLIEEERFSELPAGVYVRGFLAAYAQYLELSPDQVVPEYMERFEQERAVGVRAKRQWLSGRRG